ncbi:hypothetical protein QQS21_007395 [Conoideocrella luteorostrata]|uniref:Clr5 domain-containing protein n=1 Tax=Conoideocrella luteorostrata TaxID=1105319 RepID=A0AAJ0FS39_9HYPO|nr:hypothetical protein QQS21_007395 [Conoideocrella luteorostrata]
MSASQDIPGGSALAPAAIPSSPPSRLLARKNRSRKARTLREADWNPVKAHVLDCVKRKMTFHEIIAEIGSQLKFKATERQLKSILKKWNVGTNIRRGEMKAIIRRVVQDSLAHPDGPALQLSLRGQRVPQEKIDRFMRREGIRHDEQYSPASGASTPEPGTIVSWTLGDDTTIPNEQSAAANLPSVVSLSMSPAMAAKAISSQQPQRDQTPASPDFQEPGSSSFGTNRPAGAFYHIIQPGGSTLGIEAFVAEPFFICTLDSLFLAAQREFPDFSDGAYQITDYASFFSIHSQFPDIVQSTERHMYVCHAVIAKACLSAMHLSLRWNICRLPTHGTARDEIDTEVIKERVPDHVQYACLYFGHHLKQCHPGIIQHFVSEIERILRPRIFQWIELLAIIGKLHKCLEIIDSLINTNNVHFDINLRHRTLPIKPGMSGFLADGKRFVNQFYHAIHNWPLQVHLLSHIFVPPRNAIHDIPGAPICPLFCAVPIADLHWGSWSRRLEGHQHKVRWAVFSNDSKLLASGSNDNTVRLWDTTTWHCSRTLKMGEIRGPIIFSPDSKFLAVNLDNGFNVWRTDTWDLVQQCSSYSCQDLSFSHDPCLLTSCSMGAENAGIRLWTLYGKDDSYQLFGQGTRPFFISLSTNGKSLASCDTDGLKLWNVLTGKCWQSFNNSGVRTHGVVSFSHNSKLLAYCVAIHDKGFIKIWDTRSESCVVTIATNEDDGICSAEKGVSTLVFSHDSRLLALAYGWQADVWDATRGQWLYTFQGYSISFSYNSRLLAIPWGRTVTIWDATTNKDDENSLNIWSHWRHPTMDVDGVNIYPEEVLIGAEPVRPKSTAFKHDTDIYFVALAPNGLQFVTCGFGLAIIWETGGTPLYELQIPLNYESNALFSHDSSLLATNFEHNTVMVWDVNTGGKCTGSIRIATHSAFAFCPESTHLIVGTPSKSIQIINPGDSRVLSDISTPYYVKYVAASANLQYIASSAGFSSIDVWEIQSGQWLRTLDDPGSSVASLSFCESHSPYLASVSFEKITLWDPATGWRIRGDIDISGPLRDLSRFNDHLTYNTDRGHVCIPLISSDLVPSPSIFQGFWITEDYNWVMYESARVLYLPLEFRDSVLCTAVQGRTVVFARQSGEVVIMAGNASNCLALPEREAMVSFDL